MPGTGHWAKLSRRVPRLTYVCAVRGGCGAHPVKHRRSAQPEPGRATGPRRPAPLGVQGHRGLVLDERRGLVRVSAVTQAVPRTEVELVRTVETVAGIDCVVAAGL